MAFSEIQQFSFYTQLALLGSALVTISLLRKALIWRRISNPVKQGLLTETKTASSESYRTRTFKSKTAIAPCQEVIIHAEQTNQRNGHENDGFLSERRAFLPCLDVVAELPASHREWDELATKLPRLVKDQTLRAAIDSLEPIRADSTALDDRYLLRATSILGIIAHAYIRMTGKVPLATKFSSHSDIIPSGLLRPWTEISTRLGRQTPHMSLLDIVQYNFVSQASSPAAMTVENTLLRTSMFDTPEEHNFYGTMVEMNARTIPIFREVVNSQNAVVRADIPALKASLQRLIPLLDQMHKASLAKASPSRVSRTFVDPVVWTKTVANAAIPWIDSVMGASGTAHPFFHMMDAFISRANYGTSIGREALAVRETFPVHWRRFFEALSQVSVKKYVGDNAGDAHLSRLWHSVEMSYAGTNGILGVHRRKAFGYLMVSFRIGRSITINGHGANETRPRWTVTGNEIEKARIERLAMDDGDQLSTLGCFKASTLYNISEIIQHNDADTGYWFVADGVVYDATTFMDKHPGGRRVMELCAGQDATRELNMVAHLTSSRIQKMMEHYAIGRVNRLTFANASVQELYDRACILGCKTTETENTHRIMMDGLSLKMTGLDQPQELTPFKALHLRDSLRVMRNECAPSLTTYVNSMRAVLLSGYGSHYKEEKPERKASRAEENALAVANNDEEALSWDAAMAVAQYQTDVLAACKRCASWILQQFEALEIETQRLDSSMARTINEVLTDIEAYIAKLQL